MITVYAIRDSLSGEIYVGMTNDLERRLAEHKRKHSKYTSKFSDFILIHKEACEDYESGQKREKYLKSGYGKEFLKTKSTEAGVV